MTLDLAFQEYGAGPPVLILHGLFGSAANWGSIARRLGERFHVYALDLRNHGASPWAEAMDYAAMAEDVSGFLKARHLASAAIIGHSMGGKVAMALALAEPHLIERLVVVDIAPVVRPPVHAAMVAALKAIDLGAIHRRSDADAALHPVIPDAATRAFLLQNLVSRDGAFSWRLNLDAIARRMDEIAGFPSFPPGTNYRRPTLVIRGGLSHYVRDADLAALGALFPTFRLVTITDAGHWVHAERPAEFLEAVGPFLAGTA